MGYKIILIGFFNLPVLQYLKMTLESRVSFLDYLRECEFANICNNFSFEFKATNKGNHDLRITINPDDVKHPSIYLDNNFGVIGELLVNKVLVQKDQNPDGAKYTETSQIIAHFDSFELGSANIDLVTFGHGIRRPFNCLIINTNDGQTKITRTKNSPIRLLQERKMINQLIKRASQFKKM